ncbi:transposase, partial [Mycobacterium tuberculosis 2097HD]
TVNTVVGGVDAADVLLELATARWVDWFNHRRLYQYCGDVPPVELEAAYYAQRQRPAAG